MMLMTLQAVNTTDFPTAVHALQEATPWTATLTTNSGQCQMHHMLLPGGGLKDFQQVPTNGDAQAIETQITQAQDPAAICHHNSIHVVCWPIPDHRCLRPDKSGPVTIWQVAPWYHVMRKPNSLDKPICSGVRPLHWQSHTAGCNATFAQAM